MRLDHILKCLQDVRRVDLEVSLLQLVLLVEDLAGHNGKLAVEVVKSIVRVKCRDFDYIRCIVLCGLLSPDLELAL